MVSDTEKWFLAEVLSWRIVGGGVWSAGIGVGWTLIVTLAAILIQTPLEGCTGMYVERLTSGSTWFYLSLLIGAALYWTRVQADHASVTPCVVKSVVWTLAQTCHADRFISFLQFIGLGLGSSFILLLILSTPYTNLYTTCTDPERSYCYNNVAIFFLLAGAFSGLVEAVVFHYKNGNYTNLPIIGLDRYSQLKMKLESEFLNLCFSSLYSLRLFYPLYLTSAVLLGGIYRPAGLSYYELISPTLAATCWLVILYVKVLSSSISACVSVHSTPALHLELANLLEGTGASNQLLSVLSLQELAEQVAERPDIRREVFSLSLPGGHPHTWNSILALCNRHIGGVKDDLGKLLSPPPTQKVEAVKPPPQIEIFSPNIRRLAPVSAKQDVPCEPSSPSLPEKLNLYLDSVLESLKRRPLIGWLLTQAPDVPYRAVFTRSQSVIFCVEILSHIVSASITEDSYGVVQKDLPDILTSLLILEQNIDRCRGHGLPYYRKKSADIPDVHLKQELKCAVKSALFRIVLGFEEHILNVPLPSDLKQKIKNYQQFLEA
jgi:nucleoporin NDC1